MSHHDDFTYEYTRAFNALEDGEASVALSRLARAAQHLRATEGTDRDRRNLVALMAECADELDALAGLRG